MLSALASLRDVFLVDGPAYDPVADLRTLRAAALSAASSVSASWEWCSVCERIAHNARAVELCFRVLESLDASCASAGLLAAGRLEAALDACYLRAPGLPASLALAYGCGQLLTFVRSLLVALEELRGELDAWQASRELAWLERRGPVVSMADQVYGYRLWVVRAIVFAEQLHTPAARLCLAAR